MKNNNLLKNIHCPQCHQEDNFSIKATGHAHVTDDKATINGEALDWDNFSFTVCKACGKTGNLRDFKFYPKNTKNTMKYTHSSQNDMNGTSLRGHYTASYKSLQNIFGEPEKGDEYKVTTEWIIRGPAGEPLTIYDWKATAAFSADYPSVQALRERTSHKWHIGGKNHDDAMKFIQWLNEQTAAPQIVDSTPQSQTSNYKQWVNALAAKVTGASTPEGAAINAALLKESINNHLSTALSTTQHVVEEAMLTNDSLGQQASNYDALGNVHEALLTLKNAINEVPPAHQGIITTQRS
tara:strand:+ start:1125 stop:2009 length:885 start_codon:yes stop_codon:yes gene_type:complete